MERIAGVVGVPQQVVKRPQEFVLILNESMAQRRTDLRRGAGRGGFAWSRTVWLARFDEARLPSASLDLDEVDGPMVLTLALVWLEFGKRGAPVAGFGNP